LSRSPLNFELAFVLLPVPCVKEMPVLDELAADNRGMQRLVAFS